MKPDLSQAEVDALLGDEASSEDTVSPRDFTRPRRLGAEQLDGLAKVINSCLPGIERAMAARGGGALELSLGHIEEITRDAFLSSLDEEGFFVQSFDIDGATGWVHWAPKDARQAVERCLGCGSTSTTDAPLTELERSLAGSFSTAMAAGVAAELGLSMAPAESYVVKRLLQASIDGAPVGDEQRLSVTLGVAGEGYSSELHLYLPGVTSPEDSIEQPVPSALPGHLDDVEVLVSAELACIELPLQGFLDLEEGDVIALGPANEMRARLVVDGRPAGSATWGRDGDRLALCVEDMLIESND